jgi:hypothetical protein
MKEETPIEMQDGTRTLIRSVRCAAAGATLVALLACNAPAAFAACPNEAFRTGRSASLPDCRAYELVTPPELGRSADMTFKNEHDRFAVSNDGEHLALEAEATFFEPAASRLGTKAVFSRTPSAWRIQSTTTPAIAAEGTQIELLSPDFSQAALVSNEPGLNVVYHFEAGPVGGPYATLSIPEELGGARTFFVGANAGVPGGVPPFSDVYLTSPDHALLPPGPEREAAEETQPGLLDLYAWSGGRLRLVNVPDDGKLLNACGARLGGAAGAEEEGGAINAVSEDGSRVLFTSPEAAQIPGCPEQQLYVRVDGRETEEVSEPEEVNAPLSHRGPARYVGASRDGSRVYFTTATALTPEGGSGNLLYEYDTEAPVGHRLTLIADHLLDTIHTTTVNPGAIVSEDGSTVYYSGTSTLQEAGKPLAVTGIWRYDAITKTTSFVAVHGEAARAGEPWYVTPDGGSLVFPSAEPVLFDGPDGLQEELRGLGHNELYRYDATDGSVMCVSCGQGVAPATGRMLEPIANEGLQGRSDSQPAPVMISEDGRRVFFQTSAQLVPQDTNENTLLEELDSVSTGLGKASDVYEWEADGSEEAPGVFCHVANGCTHLISAGEAVGTERFLGASQNGQDVFFGSVAQLVPQATPEFTNVYDARVDGGLPPPAPHVECTSCQGVGSPPPQFGTPASAAFNGVGNPPVSSAAPPPPTHPPAPKRCPKGKKLGHGKCVKAKKLKARKIAGSGRRGG